MFKTAILTALLVAASLSSVVGARADDMMMHRRMMHERMMHDRMMRHHMMMHHHMMHHDEMHHDM